jgi:DNA replication and repair protein RecF
VRTTAFRNLADAVVPTAAKNIFLVGENGQGKTNFLEALYFCAYASSFRGIRDGEIAQNEKKDFSASITVTGQGNVLIKFENGKKTVFFDDKKVEDRKELLSVIPCIVFCHEDMEFVAGSPERQRWFFDQVLSLYDPVYLDDLRCYRRVLKSRNSVLRDNVLHRLNGSPEPLLDALDQQCVLYGIRLMEKRETAARLFSGIFAELYREVSGIAGVTVQYLPSWKSFNGEEAAELLRKRRVTDMAAGNSLSGPHRDRYVFAREGADFRFADFAGTASTGQRRLLALLLRVAQARRFSEMTGRNPILLLDDVLLEMDGEKRRRFIDALPDYDQAFYTFLPEEPFQNYRREDTLVYHVRDGRMEAEGQ